MFSEDLTTCDCLSELKNHSSTHYRWRSLSAGMGDTGVPRSHQACAGEARGSWGPNKLAPCPKIGWPHLAWALGTHELGAQHRARGRSSPRCSLESGQRTQQGLLRRVCEYWKRSHWLPGPRQAVAAHGGDGPSAPLTSLHHRGRLVEQGGEAVVNGSLLCHFERHHGACPCHQFCCPGKRGHRVGTWAGVPSPGRAAPRGPPLV